MINSVSEQEITNENRNISVENNPNSNSFTIKLGDYSFEYSYWDAIIGIGLCFIPGALFFRAGVGFLRGGLGLLKLTKTIRFSGISQKSIPFFKNVVDDILTQVSNWTKNPFYKELAKDKLNEILTKWKNFFKFPEDDIVAKEIANFEKQIEVTKGAMKAVDPNNLPKHIKEIGGFFITLLPQVFNPQPVQAKSNYDIAKGSDGEITDPIILDLSGMGIQLTTPQDGFFFDHDKDGLAEASSWVKSGSVFLVYDLNNNMIVDNGTELLTYNKLVELDINNDGKLDINDEEFNNLKVLDHNGNLSSLTDMGIISINLDSTSTNITDANGNYQFASGTFEKSDGSVNEYGEFMIQVDSSNSVEISICEISDEIKNLPNLDARGKVHSLHYAMQNDASGILKNLIQNFVLASTMNERETLVDDILKFWSCSQNTEDDSRGNHINATKLSIIESFMGSTYFSQYENEQIASNPNIEAAQILNSLYEKIKLNIYAELLLQVEFTDMNDLLICDINIMEMNYSYDLSLIVEKLKEEIEEDPQNGKERVYEFSKLVKGLELDSCSNFFDPKDDSCFYTTFTKDDRELKWLIDAIGKVPYTDEIGDGEGSAADDSYRLEEQGHFHYDYIYLAS